jgi:hypothetical protein
MAHLRFRPQLLFTGSALRTIDQQVLRHAIANTTIDICVKRVTQDAEESVKKLETKCSRVVPET